VPKFSQVGAIDLNRLLPHSITQRKGGSVNRLYQAMRISHSEEKRGDRPLDVLTDEENGLRIIVSRLGAELISLARIDEAGEWTGFLYRDNDLSTPPQGWVNHATVMGYYLHRLKNGRSIYRGVEIKGGNHGFLRSKTWRFVEGSDSASLKYEITPDDFSPSEYPLKVSMDLTYKIDTNKVSVVFEFRNHEPELTAHVAFGLHPGFAATSFDSFRLQMPRGCYRRYFSPGNFLSGETRDIDFPGGEMPFSKNELPGSIILELLDVRRRKFSYVDPPSGRWVTLDLTGVPYITLWSDGGPFLCVEPCWGLTDHHDQRAFEDKQGIQTISPGAELRAAFSMAPQLASCD
jgi:galactose mutarotase-like enzyme